MTLSEYQKLTPRTNADLGSKAINAAHVTLGIVGEWQEMCEAVGEDFYKEAGDCMWYISELANLFNIQLKPANIKKESQEAISWIAENVKKYLAYNKELNVVELETRLNGLVYLIEEVNEDYFKTVLDINIEKLQKRFPDKFSPEDALEKKDEI